MDNLPKGVVPATIDMAAGLAKRLSAEHQREIGATTGLAPLAALELSLSVSVEAYALLAEGDAVVFMMGVEEKSRLTGGALVWMLGSDAVRARPAATLRAARWGLARAFRITDAVRLEQFIPEWYLAGLRFARRVGFVVVPPRVRGIDGSILRRVVAYPGF